MNNISYLRNSKKVLQRLDTNRFGPFVFQLGIGSDIQPMLQRVEDAYERFAASPLSQVANQLEREVVVSSIFGTNTIEGGALSEAETADALQLDPAQTQEVEQRRALNIKAAYDYARQQTELPNWQLSRSYMLELHRLVTQDLPHSENQPGLIRDNPKNKITYVGNSEHGGRYKPPQYGKDITHLLDGLVAWHQQLEQTQVPALIRAPLVHLYFELIHPFWDGNGRVGRVIEASLLQSSGYRYAPFSLARYYLSNIHTYFSLFNACRKAEQTGKAEPNHDFVAFHLEGMRQTLNTLHDRVNAMVAKLLYESAIRLALDHKKINARQYAIVAHLLAAGQSLSMEVLRQAPWYRSLYLKLNDKTRLRDLQQLRSMQLVFLDSNNRLWPEFIRPYPSKTVKSPT